MIVENPEGSRAVVADPAELDMHSQVRDAFPELEQITDPTLQQQSEEAFVYALTRSSWTSLFDVPMLFIDQTPTGNFVEHVKIVTAIAAQAADTLLAAGHQLDRDEVLSAALLHDVGMIFEFGVVDGKQVINELVRHTFSGVHVALAVGIPDRIVHAIALHAWEGELELPPGHTIMGSRLINARTKEAMVVHYADLLASDVFRREYAERSGTAPFLQPGMRINAYPSRLQKGRTNHDQ